MIENRIISNKKLQEIFPEAFYCLNKFYPIGIKTSDDVYYDSFEYKSLDKLIQSKIVDVNVYKSEWNNDFCKNLSRILNLSVTPSTFGLVPNRSAYIKLHESDDKRYMDALHIYVSLIENYYYLEVVSTDRNFINNKSKYLDKLSWGTFSLTVSPTGKYKELILRVQEFILSNFEKAKFLPFQFELLRLENFQVTHSNSINCSVCDGFFAKSTKYTDKIKVIGDINYAY